MRSVFQKVIVALLAIYSGGCEAGSHGAPYANTGSPLGINISQQQSTGNGQQPFINILKTSGNWITTGTASVCAGETAEGAYLYANILDVNGYPTTMVGPTAVINGSITSTTLTLNSSTSGTVWINGTISGAGVTSATITGLLTGTLGAAGSTYSLSASSTVTSVSITETHTYTAICTTINQSIVAPYLPPSGNYRFTFSGAGTVAFGGDATPTTCTSSPCTVPVPSPSGAGIQIAIRATTVGNPVTNMAVVLSSNAAAFDAGEIFEPNFIAIVKNFNPLRFMQALDTIGNVLVNWTERATHSYVFWNQGDGFDPYTASKGWPYEVMFALCNEVNADCWINEPCLSNSTYVSNFAALGASLLKPNLSVYVEYCNEVWNLGSLPAVVNNGMIAAGFATFPAAGNNNNAMYLNNLQRGISDGATWKAAWGVNSNKVVRVYGGAAGNDGGQQGFFLPLTTPTFGGGSWSGTAGSNFDALATAPYYDVNAPSAWTATTGLCGSDQGVTCLLKEFADGSMLPTGAGAVTTGGTSTAYTLADGTGTGCPAAVQVNGYSTAAIFNVTNGSNPTLAVDGCAALPILCDNPALACNGAGTGVAPPASSLVVGAGNPYILVFTNATGAGSVTASWRILCGPGQKCYGSTIPDTLGFLTTNKATATTYGLQLILYEGGWGPVAPATGDIWANLYNAAAHDRQAAQLTTDFLSRIRANGLVGPFAYYDGIGTGGYRGQNWGLWDSVFQTPAPPKAQGALDFIRRNPCWWANCRH